jgi:acetyltransferase-like isoleucine patch superfamily enzyme
MRILKYLWFHFVSLATCWLPDLRPVLKLRGFLARPAFKACGRNFQVARRVTINFTNRLEIGGDVYIATGCWVNACGGIILEDEVQLGPYSVLASADHTREGVSYRHRPSKLAPIRLCHGSWLAAHATVTKGVTVGPGAVLAANSVATRDIPACAVAGGVPARVIEQKIPIKLVEKSEHHPKLRLTRPSI